MSFAKKIDDLLIKKEFQKTKIKNQIQYAKLLNAEVEYIFTYEETKSKYGADAPSYLLLEGAIRFIDVEELLQKNNREFLIAQGWKPEHFNNYRKFSCFIKEFYNGDIDKNKLDNVYEVLKISASVVFNSDDLNRFKNNIRNFEVPEEFPDSRQENIILRALLLAYIEDNHNSKALNERLVKFSNNDVGLKESLAQLKKWLTTNP